MVELKLVSILRKDVDLQSLTVSNPHVYLIIGSDGRTNVPEPKVRRTSQTSTMEDILKLAIRRFDLQRGVFEVEARSRIPFALRGENLNVRLAYDLLGPRYRGTVAIQPLYASYDDYGPTPFAVNLAVTLEKNRIAVDSGTLATGATQVQVNGALDDLNAPHARFQYQARVAVADIARIFRVPQLRNGRATADGSGEWTPAAGLALAGNVHATGVEYRDNVLRLVDFRGDGAASVSTRGVDASGLRLSGFYARGARREAVQGQVGSFALRGKDIEIGGVALSLLNGSFRGKAELRQLDRYTVTGEISGVDTRRTVAMFNSQPLPWDALVSGSVHLQGSLKRARELRAGGNLQLAPAPTGDPVHGEINVAYDAEQRRPGPGTLDRQPAAFASGFFRRHQQRTQGPPGDNRPQRPAARAGQERRRYSGKAVERPDRSSTALWRAISTTRGLRATRAPPTSFFRTSMWIRWKPTWRRPPIICACRTLPPRRGRCVRSSRVRWG